MNEWIIAEKYYLVGKLLKAGEQPTSYSDEDEEGPSSSAPTAPAAPGSAPGSPGAGNKKNEWWRRRRRWDRTRTMEEETTAATTKTITTNKWGGDGEASRWMMWRNWLLGMDEDEDGNGFRENFHICELFDYDWWVMMVNEDDLGVPVFSPCVWICFLKIIQEIYN